jgi:type VI secretion system protein ImpG
VNSKYYQDEVAYLRDLGAEFARAHPEAAHYVGESSRDPDVERLVEGFAFLTARVRQKLDDELPELTHSLLEMFWPHYLRPFPSSTLLQFEALPQAAKETRTIPRGTPVQSVPVDGTPCRFRTAWDLVLAPFSVESATLRPDAPAQLRVRLRLPDGVALSKVRPASLRFHLAGDAVVSRGLHLALCRYLRRVSVQPAAGGNAVPLPGASVKPVGFGAEEALLPFPVSSFPGFRYLQEYFSFPSKFMFVDVTGLEGLSALGDATSFDLVFELSRVPAGLPPISAAHVLLHCVPAVNLFGHEAEPIRLDQRRVEYRVVPSGQAAAHHEIFTIDKVSGVAAGSARTTEYRPFLRFARGAAGDARLYHQRLRPALSGEGSDVFLSILPGGGPGGVPEVETLSIELTCTNRRLPERLNLGDVSVPTAGSPTFAKFRNLVRPSATVPPPLDGDLHWRLLSHLALNYLSLADLDAFRRAVGLYHLRARIDRQAETALRLLLESIKKVSAAPTTRLVRGAPARGVAVELELDEDGAGGEGEAWLFGTVVDEFLGQYVAMNSFSRLQMKLQKCGEVHSWPTRSGSRILL